MEKMNVGMLGAGRIAELMAPTLLQMNCARPYAVAARELAKAKDFAGRHGIGKAYGSYREMLEDPEVELVYVATPISHHREHVLLCLEHGKHVLCEKAFAVNAKEAKEMLDAAEAKKLLLTEAIWTRYMPFSKTIMELVGSGVLGKLTMLNANLGYQAQHKESLTNPETAGGALLDIGIYPLNFAAMIFGDDIVGRSGNCVKYPTGVDAQDAITLMFSSGRMAVLMASMVSRTDRLGIVYGEDGYLMVENINNPESASLYSPKGELKKTYQRPPQISGYEYEVVSAVSAIRAGMLECPEMPHAETLRMMRLCDDLRGDLGIRYPMEG